MLRRSLIAIPALAVAAALLGVVAGDRPAVVAAVALVAGLACAAGLAAVAERRVTRVARYLPRLADGDRRGRPGSTGRRGRPGGSRAWRRLADAFDVVGASLRARFTEVTEERARSERLLDDLPLAVLLIADGRLAYANHAARELFGADAGAGAGRRPAGGGVPPPGPSPGPLAVDGLAGAVQETAETARPTEVDVRHDGRDLRGRASLLAPGEVALVLTDLTEARRVDAVRRDFVTNASHELKTPVAGIQALADSLALAVDRDPVRARRMLSLLRTEAVRLAELVRELLDLARLEEATSQRARRVDLAAVVRAQADRLAHLAGEREVAIETDLDGDASVVAVPEDLRLIVGNLMENAVRYNRRGGRVRVALRRDHGEVRLEVADTGIGISPTDRDRVFERFYRVDKGRSRAAGGTGLGLSLVRHAVQRHGGRVTLQSAPGEGSTFVVVLPVEGSRDAS